MSVHQCTGNPCSICRSYSTVAPAHDGAAVITVHPGWQRCPVCNAKGKLEFAFGYTQECPTCRGQRILNVATGRPPL